MIDEYIKHVCSSATPPLRREDVHVHITATPPCAKICPHNSGEGFELRRAEGMKFAKDTLKFLEELHENHIVDTALFENVSAVAHFW